MSEPQLPGVNLPPMKKPFEPSAAAIAKCEENLRAYLQKVVIEICKTRRLGSSKFSRKYKVSRATLFRVKAGDTVLPSDKLITVLLTEGYTLDLNEIKAELMKVENV